MANSPQLFEIHLNQLIGQIKELPHFDVNPAEFGGYIGRVKYLLQLHIPNTKIRQTHIIYDAIIKTMNWISTKLALITYHAKTPRITYVYQTTYEGSFSKFVEKSKRRSANMLNKLELETDLTDKTIYTTSLNKTIVLKENFPIGYIKRYRKGIFPQSI